MSLYKARDLWTARCGQEETFEHGSLLVTDLWGQGSDHVTVGSHDGVLRIFNPFVDTQISVDRGFSPSDVVIEIDLGQPILQLAAGRFISGSKNLNLAILHPRSLGVYNFTTISGSTEHGDQSQVFMAYEHHLKRSAYHMVTGGFGGVDGRDFVCVLGLDGTLMFYEQETHILTRNLPNFLLPFPFIYVPHTDSFVLLNSNWFLESYRYQILGEDNNEKLVSSWSYNIGEPIQSIQYQGVTTTEAAIFVLTDWNLYCFNETGVMKFCKRLQYSPLCCTIYSRGEPSVMSMIVTDTNTLMVSENTTLKWSAQLPITPVAIGRGSFMGLAGCIVILNDVGDLMLCYMGTEPTMFIPPPMQEHMASSAEIETKLQTLQHQIATHLQSSKSSLGAPAARPDLKISLKVWPMLEGDSSCKLEVSVQATIAVYSLHVNVCVTHPLVAVPNMHFLQNLGDTVEVHSAISQVSSHTVPWDLEASVLAVYLRSDMTSGSVETSIQLPAHLVVELAPPAKESDSTLILSATHPVILPTIFPEFGPDSWNGTGSNENLAGFKYKKSPDVTFTMSVNKIQQKYRIESNTLSAITLPLNILSRKMENKPLKTTQHTYALNELLDATDNHVELRNQIRSLQEKLKVGTAQMRAVQRRILSKMRDKTPADLTALSELSVYSNEYVMQLSHEIEIAQKDLLENCTRLGNLAKQTVLLVKLAGDVGAEDLKQFTESLCNTVMMSDSQGWAESTEAALNFMLRTTLARSMRDQYMPPYPEDTVVTNSANLRKYIALAIDRMIQPASVFRDDRAVSPILEGEEEIFPRESSTTPTGSTSQEDFAIGETYGPELRNLLPQEESRFE
ncbi:Bardet-Biedl syndrome 9 [Nesidiocoris tenuis]|uniref:Bardet-Biedl syndrome 9 n=1 Tax=Nesidiocoris tenuis TaxID=355587 RepID=A0ABN7AZR9_9HEMI|nr:Bardet-Biedl syndrome 9 [Nesidiocoris tenuis]